MIHGTMNADANPCRVAVVVHEDSESASAAVAREIAALIREKAARRERAVLGLATGSTPQGVYDELVRMHQQEKLSFHNVVTFNLDEYWPMAPDALQSYHRFMAEVLFDHVDIDRRHVHIPDGALPLERVADACNDYERRIRDAGGIDLQLLGIGRTGHIGFNEPGSPRASRTRLIALDKVTRLDAASDFFGEWNVPRRAITMGVGTILEARRIVLLAFGEGKARIVAEAAELPVRSAVAASYLQEHPNCTFVLDPAAAGELTMVKTPWLLGPLADRGLSWDAELTRRAVVWLSQTRNKPILKLVEEDYNEHGLQELLSTRGSAYVTNLEVFGAMRDTITGWPGGKPRPAGAPLPDRDPPTFAVGHGPAPRRAPAGPIVHAADAFPKRVVVFSPHPDDDVISMGGTLMRLCEQGHDVHVAYQTSGNIAVFDEKAVRHADFVAEFAREFGLLSEDQVARIEAAVERFVAAKRPGQIDSAELQKIKTLIRRSEARAAARFAGVREQNIHFLDLPFYETGRVRKRPLSDADIQRVRSLLQRIRPHQVYAAGDLSDPHGTHRVCLKAIAAAVTALREAARRPTPAMPADAPHVGDADADTAWIERCDVWLYRGAWQEWEPWQIEMAVPLSPDEVERKRHAIFFHESQKDKALFPGPWDVREFWQRAEDRNRRTAELYDALGLPEYQALEAFVRWRD